MIATPEAVVGEPALRRERNSDRTPLQFGLQRSYRLLVCNVIGTENLDDQSPVAETKKKETDETSEGKE